MSVCDFTEWKDLLTEIPKLLKRFILRTVPFTSLLFHCQCPGNSSNVSGLTRTCELRRNSCSSEKVVNNRLHALLTYSNRFLVIFLTSFDTWMLFLSLALRPLVARDKWFLGCTFGQSLLTIAIFVLFLSVSEQRKFDGQLWRLNRFVLYTVGNFSRK